MAKYSIQIGCFHPRSVGPASIIEFHLTVFMIIAPVFVSVPRLMTIFTVQFVHSWRWLLGEQNFAFYSPDFIGPLLFVILKSSAIVWGVTSPSTAPRVWTQLLKAASKLDPNHSDDKMSFPQTLVVDFGLESGQMFWWLVAPNWTGGLAMVSSHGVAQLTLGCKTSSTHWLVLIYARGDDAQERWRKPFVTTREQEEDFYWNVVRLSAICASLRMSSGNSSIWAPEQENHFDPLRRCMCRTLLAYSMLKQSLLDKSN